MIMKNSVICILAVFLCSKPFAQSITPNLVFATFSNEVVEPAKFISFNPATKEVRLPDDLDAYSFLRFDELAFKESDQIIAPAWMKCVHPELEDR